MRPPFAHLTAPRRVLLMTTAATLLVMAALTATGASLKTAAAPAGIVTFELAGSPAATARVLESWGPAQRLDAAFNLGLDYLFLVLYATAIALACGLAARALKARAWRHLGAALAWGQGLAALLDAVENAALYRLLTDPVASPWPEVAALCAWPKFALVGCGLLYSLGGLIATLRPETPTSDSAA